MRILLVSDLQYNLPQLDWVVGASADFDLVVLAGDQLNVASILGLDAHSVVVLRYLSLLDEAGRVVVASGNHDLTGPDEHGEQSALWLAAARGAGIPSDGDSLFLDDLLVTVCPWWDGPIGRETLAAQLGRDFARRPGTWLWVYHWPPLGSSTCWTGRKEYGDADLGALIDEYCPDLVLCGHVHQAPFSPGGAWVDRVGDTWVLNAGHQIGPIPAHVEIDLGQGRARWISLLGSEEVDLSATVTPRRVLF